jgi:predicted NAD-dependent protein-ADP-ribosyltransferase YbiA (DUF1768 family)
MKTDITIQDLDHLLRENTYAIDILQGDESRHVFINSQTLFKKHDLLEQNPELREQLRQFNEMRLADAYKKWQLLGNMKNVNIPLEADGEIITVLNAKNSKSQVVLSSEHLYQALKFPEDAIEIQRGILSQSSSMIAKNITKRYSDRIKDSFRGFNREMPENNQGATLDVIRIMYQVLLIKLAYKQNVTEEPDENDFGLALKNTGNKMIVEVAPKQNGRVDTFWGTKINDDGTLKGRNVMGKLLMFIRDNYLEDINNNTNNTRIVNIPDDLNLSLLGHRLTVVNSLIQ